MSIFPKSRRVPSPPEVKGHMVLNERAILMLASEVSGALPASFIQGSKHISGAEYVEEVMLFAFSDMYANMSDDERRNYRLGLLSLMDAADMYHEDKHCVRDFSASLDYGRCDPAVISKYIKDHDMSSATIANSEENWSRVTLASEILADQMGVDFTRHCAYAITT